MPDNYQLQVVGTFAEAKVLARTLATTTGVAVTVKRGAEAQAYLLRRGCDVNAEQLQLAFIGDKWLVITSPRKIAAAEKARAIAAEEAVYGYLADEVSPSHTIDDLRSAADADWYALVETAIASTEEIDAEDRCRQPAPKTERVQRKLFVQDRTEALRIARQRRGAVSNAKGGGHWVTFRERVLAD
jgi:hypothetical protein